MTSAQPGRMPVVSVIMPCLDGLPFLEEAVRGVLDQAVDLELLVVDGGSSDGSLEWVRSLDDDRVRPLEVPSGTTPGEARNVAASVSRAPALAFADADDVWRGDKLARQLEHPLGEDTPLVFSDCTVIDRAGSPLGALLSRHRPRSGRVFDDLLLGNFVPLSTVVVDRVAFDRVGGFPRGYRVAGDYLFLLRLARLGDFRYDPQPLCLYRIHERNVTGDHATAYAENLQVFETLAAEVPRSEKAALRRARAIVLWRWTVRDLLAGPSRWPAALDHARVAIAVSGGLAATLEAIGATMTSTSRGLGLRWRMARARRAG